MGAALKQTTMAQYNLRMTIDRYRMIFPKHEWHIKRSGDVDMLPWQACPVTAVCDAKLRDGSMNKLPFIRAKNVGKMTFPMRMQLGNRTIESEGRCGYAHTFGCFGPLPAEMCDQQWIRMKRATLCSERDFELMHGEGAPARQPGSQTGTYQRYWRYEPS